VGVAFIVLSWLSEYKLRYIRCLKYQYETTMGHMDKLQQLASSDRKPTLARSSSIRVLASPTQVWPRVLHGCIGNIVALSSKRILEEVARSLPAVNLGHCSPGSKLKQGIQRERRVHRCVL
jgi:hypothetical protein